MRVLVGYTNHIPQIAEGLGLPGREQAGDSILAFGAGYAQLPVTPDMGWQDILARCPQGWQPDVYIHWSPEYNPIPAGLETADCLTVGVWGDWNLGGRAMRAVSGLFDVLVADQVGCERLQNMGFDNVLPALLWAFDPAKHRRLDAPHNVITPAGMAQAGRAPSVRQAQNTAGTAQGLDRRDIDILMIGNFNHAVQWERAPWLARVAALSDRYNVVLTSGLYDDAYVQTMNRAKIVFNRSIRGEANMRAYEAPACGALMFYEASNREIRAIYEDGVHCVLYDDATLEDLLAYYLAPENHSARIRIAQAGWERAQAHSYAHHFADLLTQLEPLCGTRKRRISPRLDAQQQIALAAHWLLTCNVNVYHRADALLTSLAAAPPPASRTHPNAAANTRLWAQVANLHAVLCGEVAHCAAAPAYKHQSAQAALRHARQAVHCAPDWLIARFNLAYLTLATGKQAEAETLLCDLTIRLDAIKGSAKSSTEEDSANIGSLDGPTFPRRFDWFDVAVERLYGECAPDSRAGRPRMLALLTGRAHLTLAEIMYARGQFAASAAHARQAVDALPNVGEAHYALALALRVQGRVAESIAAYRQTLILAPFHIAARDELARLLLDVEQTDAAIASLNAWLAVLRGCPAYAEHRAAAELLRRQALHQHERQQQSQVQQAQRNSIQASHVMPKRLLAFPDWRRADGWQRIARAFAHAYTPADPVVLLLRADPNDCPNAQLLLTHLEQFLTCDLGCDADALPNITLLHQPLPPADGWKLLRVADAVLSDDLTEFWRELAHAACVPIIACDDLAKNI